MKTLVWFIFLGLSLSLRAQEKETKGTDLSPEARTEIQLIKMREHLALSEAQIKEIQPLLERHHRDISLHKEQLRSARQEMKSKKESLHAELKEILDAEQFQKLEEHRKHHKEGAKKHRERRRLHHPD